MYGINKVKENPADGKMRMSYEQIDAGANYRNPS